MEVNVVSFSLLVGVLTPTTPFEPQMELVWVVRVNADIFMFWIVVAGKFRMRS